MEDKDLKIIYEGIFIPWIQTQKSYAIEPFISVIDMMKEEDPEVFNKQSDNESDKIYKLVSEMNTKLSTDEGTYSLFEQIFVPYINNMNKTEQKTLITKAKEQKLFSDLILKATNDFTDLIAPVVPTASNLN